MPDKAIVINTGPMIALIAATGNLNILKTQYERVFVTLEVKREICFKGQKNFAVNEFLAASFLHLVEQPITLSPILRNSLDTGEASVIQYALDNQIDSVCIDEVAGRRTARLHDLNVTGSLGVLLKAKSEGLNISIRHCINNMQKKGIFLSSELINKAIQISGE
jgi:predicted nucleic acid-binding protein